MMLGWRVIRISLTSARAASGSSRVRARRMRFMPDRLGATGREAQRPGPLFDGARFGSIRSRHSPMEDSMPNPMIPRRSVVAGGAALALGGLPHGARAARTRFVTANNNPYDILDPHQV